MIFQAKHISSACLILLAALVRTAVPTAYGQIPMRGFNSDLSSTEEQFLSLDLNGDGKANALIPVRGGYAGAYLSHGDGTFHNVSYVNGGTPQNGFTGNLTSTLDAFVPLDLNGVARATSSSTGRGGDTIRYLSQGDGTVNCNNLSASGSDDYGFADSMTNGSERIVALNMIWTSSRTLSSTHWGADYNAFTSFRYPESLRASTVNGKAAGPVLTAKLLSTPAVASRASASHIAA